MELKSTWLSSYDDVFSSFQKNSFDDFRNALKFES